MTLTAIPTRYADTLFRSRLEARWAVFFDSLGIPWRYEFEGYQTNAGWYLPDFWLPSLQIFAEVKPRWPNRDALAKCADVAHGTRFPFVILDEEPAVRWYMVLRPDDSIEWLDWDWTAGKERLWYAYMGPERPDDRDCSRSNRIIAATKAAEHYRFA